MSFPKYPAYKDSGVEWIGEIPVGWEYCRLRFVAQFNPSKTEISYIPLNEEVSFLPMEAIGDDGTINLGQKRKISDVQNGYTYFRDMDVIFAKITPCFENGKGALAQGLLRGIGFGTTELIVARSAPSRVIPEYLLRFFQSDIFRKPAEASMYGAGGQKRVSESFVRDFSIPLPPLPEQQAIASFLDRECGKIDALIAEQERLIALLAEKRQAVISHAVTKGLNPNVPMKDSGIPWIGMVPEGWEVVKLKRVGKLKGGYAFSTDLFVESGIPVVRMSNLKRGEIDFSDSVFINSGDLVPSASLSEGDLIWGMSGSIGVTGSLGNYARVKQNDIPCQLNQRVGCFSLSKLNNDFMECIVQADFFCDQIILSCTGTAQFNVSSSQVEDCYIVVPPMEDQKHISNFLKAYFQKQSTLYATSEQSITLLRERRATLISAAVTGKIDVRAQSKAFAA
ncbi:restriction endonuclease subunit S [Acetobacter sp.]|jgi:type I restriction enzyme S subunit|uniref:restriction endonuclease subunit S n=1 Tax=Acetobacter sp. TaxID=440 RepID=UPI0025BD3AA6|nr:restriction endonuclease subunit S [Acetobacter sp.]MCI1301311.1 restriction endonuclease subunit S [Acetobacter sp.]